MRILIVVLFTFISIIWLISCENGSTDPSDEQVQVEISKEYLADEFGDQNGIASDLELEFVKEYFNIHGEMWLVTRCMKREGNTVKADTVKKYFKPMSIPYSSEEKLRSENIRSSIRTPLIGITIVTKSSDYEVTKTFRSPGPKYSEAEWVELKIIK